MSLHDQAMLVTLSLSRYGLNRKDENEAEEVARRHGGDSKSFGVTKRLLAGNAAFDAIRKFDAAVGIYNRKQTLAWNDDGTRILPTTQYDAYMTHMRAERAAREKLVAEFLRGYDAFVQGDRTKLGTAFKSDDYLDRYIVRERFSFTVAVAPVPDGKDFRVTMSKSDIIDMQKNVAAQIQTAEDHARREMMSRLAVPLLKMAEKLGDRDKKMTLTTTVPLVENLREILDMLPRLNVLGDSRIEEFRKTALDQLSNITAETLKTNPLVRTVAAQKAQEIVDAMSDFMGPAQVSAVA